MSAGPYFAGELLVAMPGIGDPRFDRTVIYLCAHNAEGAMGLVINRRQRAMRFAQLLQQLDIALPATGPDVPVYNGGPVEPGRGFVLHRGDGDTAEDISVTATTDILVALAGGVGPPQALVTLGYAGWQPGQLDRELAGNGWLTARASPELVFETPDSGKWAAALASLGVDVAALSQNAGHA